MRRLGTRARETLRKPPCAFPRTDSESGLTLVELMAAVVIGGLVSFAVVYLWNAVDQLYQSISVHANATTDASFVYWDLEKLAQNTLVVKKVSNKGTVLVLQVSKLALWRLAPQNSAVYKAAAAGGLVCATFAQNDNGMTVLELYPQGRENAATPLFSGVTSFSGSTFRFLSSTSFSVTLRPSVQSSAHTNVRLESIRYQYGIGMSGY
ncbi:MAG: prepilin-type N-terminal cleavage/methylation domain-containing protein [Bacilli bacterium]